MVKLMVVERCPCTTRKGLIVQLDTYRLEAEPFAVFPLRVTITLSQNGQHFRLTSIPTLSLIVNKHTERRKLRSAILSVGLSVITQLH